MRETWQFFFLMTFICVFIEGFFSAFEMAFLSINKVRLNYYAVKGNKRAQWLTSLLGRPTYLYGTILIGVNTVIQLGSEYSRRFYEALGLPPNIAPLTQIVIVLIFGELAPAFAARKHAEQVALLGVPIVYFLLKILTPFVWLIDKISQLMNSLLGAKAESFLLITKDEVERAFEEKEMGKDDANQVVKRVFSLEEKKAGDLMISLDRFLLLTHKNTIGDVKKEGSIHYPYLYLFRNDPRKITGCVQLKDLLDHSSEDRLTMYAKPPWFIIEMTPVLQVLRDFRNNRQEAAVVMDQSGKAIGILTLDQIIDALFGQQGAFPEGSSIRSRVVVDRTLSGEMTVAQFNEEFEVTLPFDGKKTLEEILLMKLGHHPSEGDRAIIGEFEFQVVESTLLGVRLLSVRSL